MLSEIMGVSQPRLAVGHAATTPCNGQCSLIAADDMGAHKWGVLWTF